MRKSGRKFLGMMLAASMAVAAIFPLQSTAAGLNSAENGDTSQEIITIEEHIPQESNTLLEETTQQEETETGTLPFSYDVNPPVIESFELEEQGKTLPTNSTIHFNMSVYDADSGIKSVTVGVYNDDLREGDSLELLRSTGNLYTGTLHCGRLKEGKYHVSYIQVEDNAQNYVNGTVAKNGHYLYEFTLDNEGKVSVSNLKMQANPANEDGKLRAGESVTYTADATLSNEEINHAWICISTRTDNYLGTISPDMEYDAAANQLTASYLVTEETYPSEWEVSYIQVRTKAGKYYSFYPVDLAPDGNLKFTVAQDNFDTEKPIIESITLDKNGESVAAGDTIALTVKVKEEHPSQQARACFAPQDSRELEPFYIDLELDAAAMEYRGSITVTKDTYPCVWALTFLSIPDEIGHWSYLHDFRPDWQTALPWQYTVLPDSYVGKDKESPVIESIALDKNKQWLQAGDVINLSIKVREEHPSSTAIAYFYPQARNVSGYKAMELTWEEETMEYVGSMAIQEDTYPCEWVLRELYLSDLAGNRGYLTDFQEDFELMYPWYFRVKSGNTYREDVKNVTFSFYGFVQNMDGSYQNGALISSSTVENLGRRATLKELGVFPEPMEGVNATWTDWRGREIDGDTELLFDSQKDMTCIFSATYEKGCANVSLTYMSKEDGKKTVILPNFVDKDATYQEVMERLELPDDARTEDFAGFRFGYSNGYHEDDTPVGDVCSFSVEAMYNNCQVAWTARYLGEDGKEVSRVITEGYREGTSIKDALAGLEAPEDTGGLTFEGWVLPDIEEGYAICQPMEGFQAVAVYHGKTTVDASYTYRGEDGELVWDSKMVALDGEHLSDGEVQGEATEVFKSVSHLAGLKLSEWTGTIDRNQEKYKRVQFQALYYNCVAVLKYPDETCQYVVLDKNTAFPLPTESEKYKEILWEGFEKGEIVTVTEDREFLVKEAKLWDGTEEQPEGVRLPEEEIEKIKEELAAAEAGAAITIDMKKATVVPKEVLEAIQGKAVDIFLDMGRYGWSISGTDVVATELKDIDLEVKIGTDAVPPSLVESFAGGKPATQLSLTHNGEFGFRADLVLHLGSENSGGTGNLYYYDSSGKLVFRDSGQIGADGTTTLSFSHASDYVVIIDKGASSNGGGQEGSTGAGSDKTEGSAGTGSGTEGTAGAGGDKTEGSTGTGSGKTEGTGSSENEESAGAGSSTKKDPAGLEDGSSGQDPTGRDGTEEGSTQDEGLKDTRKKETDTETITIYKKKTAVTTDSGQSTAGNPSPSGRKSPKTGE